MKKTLLFFLLILPVLNSVIAQNAQDSLWIRNNYIKKEIYIPMRDGTRLFTSLYIPKDSLEKHRF